MATIQVSVDESIKAAADSFFDSLGLDTESAVKMFISSALDKRAVPFEVKPRESKKDMKKEGFSEEYIAKIKEMWKSPDPTFIEQPEIPFTDRGELFQ